jgi:hypothetical protein
MSPLPGDGAAGVEVPAGGTVLADLGHLDDDLGAFLDGLGAGAAVEIGRGVAGIDGVDPDAGNALAYCTVTVLTAVQAVSRPTG